MSDADKTGPASAGCEPASTDAPSRRSLQPSGDLEVAALPGEQRYRLLFDSLLYGFCTIEMIFDESDNPIDYRFIEVNDEFERQTGLHDVQGKRIRELAPDNDPYWYEIYGRVALTGEPSRFAAPATPLGRDYEVSAFRVGGPGSREVGIVFNDVTERVRAEALVGQELATTRALLDVASSTATLGLDALLDRLVAVIAERLGRSRVVLHLFEGEREMRTLAATDLRVLSIGQIQRLDDYSPEAAAAPIARRPVIVDFRADDLSAAATLERDRLQAELVLYVPLVAHGDLLGVVTIDEPLVHGPFSERDIEIASGIAAQAAIAIENARLFEARESELDRTTVLREAAAAAAGTIDEYELSALVLEACRKRLGAKAGTVYVIDREAGVLAASALFGFPKALMPQLQRMELDEARAAARSYLKREVVTHDAADLPSGIIDRAQAADAAHDRWVSLPIRARDGVVGSLGLVFPGQRAFSAAEIALYQSLADQLGVGLEKARLFEAQQEQSRLARSMVEISASLASSLDLDETLVHVLDQVMRELGASGAAVADRVEEGWRLRDLSGVSAPGVERGALFTDEQAPSLMRAFVERQPQFVSDIPNAPDVNAHAAERLAVRAYAAYPLIVRDEVSGGLTVYFPEPRVLSKEERDYLRRVAFALSLSEENSRLYKAERRIAETLQTALITLPGSVRGLDIAHAYQSASEDEFVGGDFYDIFRLDHDRVGITIGDIAGKGLGAAVLTSLVKNAIRAYANQRAATPAQVLTLTNDLVQKSSATEAFATVFFGILDRSDGRLSYANAGHTTAVVIGRDAVVRRLPVTDPILGAFAPVEFLGSEARVETDEALFLYTDGLTEARRGKEMYGEARLLGLLASSGAGSVREVVHEVLRDVLSFASGHLRDDLAILAVRRVETPGPDAGDDTQRVSQ